jgi:DNA repair protein RecO (recombination protein O)
VLHLLDEGADPLFLLRIFEIKFLSLLGYQPKLDRCLSCGLQPKGEVIFLGMKGGMLCPDCMVSSGGPRILLSQGTLGFYYQALRMDMDKVCRLKPSTSIMQELDQALSAHTFHILGKRLNSAEFLAKVFPSTAKTTVHSRTANSYK